MHKRAMIGIVLLSIVWLTQTRAAFAQNSRLQKIEDRLTALEQRIAPLDGSHFSIVRYLPAIPVLAVALFCGRWAQLNGRDFWLWFLSALIFNILALIFLWCCIEDDKKAKRASKEQARQDALDA